MYSKCPRLWPRGAAPIPHPRDYLIQPLPSYRPYVNHRGVRRRTLLCSTLPCGMAWNGDHACYNLYAPRAPRTYTAHAYFCMPLRPQHCLICLCHALRTLTHSHDCTIGPQVTRCWLGLIFTGNCRPFRRAHPRLTGVNFVCVTLAGSSVCLTNSTDNTHTCLQR